MNDQASLELQEPASTTGDSEPTFALGTYRRELVATAKDAALTRARQGDPDLFDAALNAIRRLAATGVTFDSDDVVSELGGVSGPAVGTATRTAASSGIIVFAGVTTSTRPASHGRLIRTWRGAR